jgi:hypothetical protein
MFRTTREQLRRYRERGILADPVPVRDPQPCWIALSHEEWELYRRVEDYVSDFYQRYEGERRGLGFIMTVYRRRLTSSFAALARSLERRRAYLLDLRGPVFGLTDEDAEDDDLGQDVVEDLEAEVQEGRLPPRCPAAARSRTARAGKVAGRRAAGGRRLQVPAPCGGS